MATSELGGSVVPLSLKHPWRRVAFAAAVAAALASPALADHRSGGQSTGGHWGGDSGWHYHPGWHGDIRHFDHNYWHGGHWWHGTYGARLGWWWIVGPDWYWYAAPVYPYRQYYPYVGVCPSGWRAVPAE
jgi:hypothetical protein